MTKQIENKAPKYYALQETPRGKALFTYMIALLTVNGMFTPNRRPAPVSAITRYFYSPSAVNHHTRNGNLEKEGGMLRLTVTGWNHFNGRLTGQTVGQEVLKKEADLMAVALRTGIMPEKTQHFGPSTKFREITL